MATSEPHPYEDVDVLREALVGRSVVAVKMADPQMERQTLGKWGPTIEGEVRLDDGTVLLLAGNEGGCSCSAGDYELARLNAMPINGITAVDVELDNSQIDPEWGEGPQTYRIFVLGFDGARSELAVFEGSDGNGYYGTGFWFQIVGGVS